MDPTSLAQIANWCDGALLRGVPDVMVSSLSTDSRTIKEGDVFLSLKGDNFDGHKFIDDVDGKGASCVIVSDLSSATESCACAVIHVRNVLNSLQKMAGRYRNQLDEPFVLGVTGSNGKTSTKDFLNSIMSVAGPVNATKGNLNNHIGLPLTVLDTNSAHQSMILEMGMNHPGEIEVLAEIGNPDAAVITNIGSAHIEHMKTRDAIAKEKSCLAQAVSSTGYCVMPVADEFYPYVEDITSCRMVSVGIDKGDIRASGVLLKDSGQMSFDLSHGGDDTKYEVNLQVRGHHMVSNALLAAAVGFEQGVSGADIAEALSLTALTGGRLEEKQIMGVDFLDDSYNANPESMRAAIDVLAASTVSGRRVAILGFMGELGESEEKEHLAIGAAIAQGSIDILVTVGERAGVINAGAEKSSCVKKNFEEHEAASRYLQDNLVMGDLALVKGSRAAGMEKILQFLNQ